MTMKCYSKITYSKWNYVNIISYDRLVQVHITQPAFSSSDKYCIIMKLMSELASPVLTSAQRSRQKLIPASLNPTHFSFTGR